jgi:hypothetical protein
VVVAVTVTEGVCVTVVAPSAVSESDAVVCNEPLALAATSTVGLRVARLLPGARGLLEVTAKLQVSVVPLETAQLQPEPVGEEGKLSPLGKVTERARLLNASPPEPPVDAMRLSA